MASIVVNGDTSGSVTLSAPAVAGTVTVTLPSASGTMAVSGGSPSFTTITTTSDASISGLTVGKGAGADSTSTAVGSGALATSGGSTNTAVGFYALNANSSGTANTSIGRNTLLANTSGGSNVAVGHQALTSNTTASNNTAVGYQAGYGVTTSGDGNVFLGYTAGNNQSTGHSGVYLGTNTRASSSSANWELVVGANIYSTVTGKGASTGFIAPGGNGAVYQGNNSSTWSTTSDQRLKKNIVDHTEGLDKIAQICVRNFEYRLPEEVTELDPQNAIAIQGVQLGVIAQELQQVLPDCVKEESTGVLSVDTSNITWHMINAIKDLKAELDTVKAELAALKG